MVSDRDDWILADLLFFENVTSGPVAGAVGLAVVPAAAGLGLGVPNASVFTWSGGTPSSVRMAFVESIIDGGPHRWILREARLGTVCVSNSFVMRPRGPFQSVPSALEIVTATCNFGFNALKRGDFVRENEVGRSAARIDEEDVSGP